MKHYHNKSDTQLIKDCLNGDEGAYSEIINRYNETIYSIAIKKYKLNEDIAGDIFIKTAEKILKNLAKLKKVESLRQWIISITKNECIDYLRNSKDEISLDETEQIKDPTIPSLEESFTEEEKSRIVKEVLNEKKDKKCKEIIERHYYNGEKHEEISIKMGIPIGSIRPTLARNFKKLEKILNKKGINKKNLY